MQVNIVLNIISIAVNKTSTQQHQQHPNREIQLHIFNIIFWLIGCDSITESVPPIVRCALWHLKWWTRVCGIFNGQSIWMTIMAMDELDLNTAQLTAVQLKFINFVVQSHQTSRETSSTIQTRRFQRKTVKEVRAKRWNASKREFDDRNRKETRRRSMETAFVRDTNTQNIPRLQKKTQTSSGRDRERNERSLLIYS